MLEVRLNVAMLVEQLIDTSVRARASFLRNAKDRKSERIPHAPQVDGIKRQNYEVE